MLGTERITVRFGGVVANDGISVSIESGTVTALIGPNGAGKTTFFGVLTGSRPPDEGRVFLFDRDVTGWPPEAVARLGVARTFQNLELFESLTVLENVLVGASRFARPGPVHSLIRSPRSVANETMLRTVAGRALELVGLTLVRDESVGDLPYGLRRRVEIARALAGGPRLLLLDEPSAGMDPHETRDLGELISRLTARLKLTVLLVEHDMIMVRDFVDDVLVLDAGRLIVRGQPGEVLSDPRVARVYLGSRG